MSAFETNFLPDRPVQESRQVELPPKSSLRRDAFQLLALLPAIAICGLLAASILHWIASLYR